MYYLLLILQELLVIFEASAEELVLSHVFL